jgi:hypothetical protein
VFLEVLGSIILDFATSWMVELPLEAGVVGVEAVIGEGVTNLNDILGCLN